jgi:hypothetical protein
MTIQANDDDIKPDYWEIEILSNPHGEERLYTVYHGGLVMFEALHCPHFNKFWFWKVFRGKLKNLPAKIRSYVPLL